MTYAALIFERSRMRLDAPFKRLQAKIRIPDMKFMTLLTSSMVLSCWTSSSAAQGQGPVPAEPLEKEPDTTIGREWGLLGRLAGNTFYGYDTSPGEAASLSEKDGYKHAVIIVTKYSWNEFGKELRVDYEDANSLAWSEIFTYLGPKKFEGVHIGSTQSVSFTAHISGKNAYSSGDTITVTYKKGKCTLQKAMYQHLDGESVFENFFTHNCVGDRSVLSANHLLIYRSGEDELASLMRGLPALRQELSGIERDRIARDAEQQRRDEYFARQQQQQVDAIYREGSARAASILAETPDIVRSEEQEISRTYDERVGSLRQQPDTPTPSNYGGSRLASEQPETDDASSSSVVRQSSSTAASEGQNAPTMWDVEVWCYATRIEHKRFPETIGSRSVERHEGILHSYISPLTPIRVSYDDRFQDRFEAQWASYLSARGISVDTSGCNIGSGQFASHNTSQGPGNPLTRLDFTPQ